MSQRSRLMEVDELMGCLWRAGAAPSPTPPPTAREGLPAADAAPPGMPDQFRNFHKGAEHGSAIDAGMAATGCGRPGWLGLVSFGHGGWDSVGWEGVALAHGDEAR